MDPAANGGTVLERLRDLGITAAADCGGRGVCGKCRVRFTADPPAADETERKVLGDAALREGWRLACRTSCSGECEVELPAEAGETIAAETSFFRSTGAYNAAESAVPVLAVDVGTTTIAAAVRDPAADGGVRTASCANRQRSCGADVISRIAAANRGEGETLRRYLMEDIKKLAGELGISGEDFGDPEKLRIVISGNSTMEHLLQGLPCGTLGVSPYTPVDISLHEYENMTILPGVSTFVGADIVSGMVACGMDESEEIGLLIDLGTNGEMVLGNRHRRICASTAAGPAFEGGCIEHGTAGIPGAICAIEITGGRAECRTLGGQPPLGICGTGVLEAVYELLKEGLIDETGLLDEEYFDGGFPLAEGICFTAKDVREVQLAKAAVRAGLEVLLAEYGITCGEVAHVWLAGGFGRKVNAAKAVGIGLIPPALGKKIVPVGNSSLAGALLYAEALSAGTAGARESSGGQSRIPEAGTAAQRFCGAASGTKEIVLAENRLFNGLYIEHMMFPEQ